MDEELLTLENQRLERLLRESRATLLDDFAKAAMQGWIATLAGKDHPVYSERGCAIVAKHAYELARAMLNEKERQAELAKKSPG
jgi:hypothetical protein